MEKRKLASIQYVHDITPIERADKIECVHVLGWKCVANKGQFHVGDSCTMWRYANDHRIEDALRENQIPNVAIQGEFCGAGIQKNRLKLIKPEWYVFTIVDMETRRRYSLDQMTEFCKKIGLKMVPVEERGTIFPYYSIEELLERAKGKYASGMNKEGIVISPTEAIYSRTIEGPLSMKVLNNDYLLKE